MGLTGWQDKTAEENNTLCIGEKQKEARFEVEARFETSEEARTDSEMTDEQRNRMGAKPN
jgi:hypothetical protein